MWCSGVLITSLQRNVHCKNAVRNWWREISDHTCLYVFVSNRGGTTSLKSFLKQTRAALVYCRDFGSLDSEEWKRDDEHTGLSHLLLLVRQRSLRRTTECFVHVNQDLESITAVHTWDMRHLKGLLPLSDVFRRFCDSEQSATTTTYFCKYDAFTGTDTVAGNWLRLRKSLATGDYNEAIVKLFSALPGKV